MAFFQNEKCGGIQLYRPVSKINTKEDNAHIVAAIKRIEEEVEKIEETTITYKEKTLRVSHTTLLTMLDGKGRSDLLF